MTQRPLSWLQGPKVGVVEMEQEKFRRALRMMDRIEFVNRRRVGQCIACGRIFPFGRFDWRYDQASDFLCQNCSWTRADMT